MMIAATTITTVKITRASNVKPTARPTLLPVAGALVGFSGEPVVGFSGVFVVWSGLLVDVGQIVWQLVREEVDMTGAPLLVLLRLVVSTRETEDSILWVETGTVVFTSVGIGLFSTRVVNSTSVIAMVVSATVVSSIKASISSSATLLVSGGPAEVTIGCAEVGSIGTTDELTGHKPIVVQPSGPTRSSQESA